MTPPEPVSRISNMEEHLLALYHAQRVTHRLLAFTIVLGTLALTAALWALLLVLP